LFVNGTFVVVAFAMLVVLMQPKSIPFVLHGLTLFMLVRSGFTLLTHLGPPEAHYASDFGETITRAFFGSDQFFSGHTGMPFLAALAYWHIPWIRNVFLAATAYFVVIVLLGHIHYSIDVASAFFITYGVYQIAIRAFEKEYRLFRADTSAG
ncbi:MAG: phosphatase PAP2-related protein, partial [Sedimentisphaerales bacterium]|nr:phosphatase PAP2-related protein [Sedimentisphaerales bacterium]